MRLAWLDGLLRPRRVLELDPWCSGAPVRELASGNRVRLDDALLEGELVRWSAEVRALPPEARRDGRLLAKHRLGCVLLGSVQRLFPRDRVVYVSPLSGEPWTPRRPRVLLKLGIWRSGHVFVDREWEPNRRCRVVHYLRSGTFVDSTPGLSRCPLDCGATWPERAEFTDGTLLWPECLAHLVEVHEARLPERFLAHMAQNDFAIRCDPEDVVSYAADLTWWRSWYCDQIRVRRDPSRMPVVRQA